MKNSIKIIIISITISFFKISQPIIIIQPVEIDNFLENTLGINATEEFEKITSEEMPTLKTKSSYLKTKESLFESTEKSKKEWEEFETKHEFPGNSLKRIEGLKTKIEKQFNKFIDSLKEKKIKDITIFLKNIGFNDKDKYGYTIQISEIGKIPKDFKNTKTIEKTTNIKILTAIKDAILSYLDENNLVKRISSGKGQKFTGEPENSERDEYIYSMPEVIIVLEQQNNTINIYYYPTANQSKLKLTELEAPKPEPGFFKKAFMLFLAANVALQEGAKVYSTIQSVKKLREMQPTEINSKDLFTKYDLDPANPKEFERVMRKILLKYHPDKNKEPDAAEKYMEIMQDRETMREYLDKIQKPVQEKTSSPETEYQYARSLS
ncbi:MAG: hypothetical protein ABIA74_00695 [bacterium]